MFLTFSCAQSCFLFIEFLFGRDRTFALNIEYIYLFLWGKNFQREKFFVRLAYIIKLMCKDPKVLMILCKYRLQLQWQQLQTNFYIYFTPFCLNFKSINQNGRMEECNEYTYRIWKYFLYCSFNPLLKSATEWTFF